MVVSFDGLVLNPVQRVYRPNKNIPVNLTNQTCCIVIEHNLYSITLLFQEILVLSCCLNKKIDRPLVIFTKKKVFTPKLIEYQIELYIVTQCRLNNFMYL